MEIVESKSGGGNVGIGMTTTAPVNKLDVNGTLAVGSYAGVNTATANGMIVSGNVGIGVTAPSQKLDVNGIIKIEGTGSFGSVSPGLSLFNGSDDYKIGFSNDGSRGLIRYNVDSATANHGHLFSAGPAGSQTDLMYIRGDGNVGIGTTSPGSKLDIWGSLNVATGSNPTLFVNTATQNVGIGTSTPTLGPLTMASEIGRASCRERV